LPDRHIEAKERDMFRSHQPIYSETPVITGRDPGDEYLPKIDVEVRCPACATTFRGTVRLDDELRCKQCKSAIGRIVEDFCSWKTCGFTLFFVAPSGARHCLNCGMRKGG